MSPELFSRVGDLGSIAIFNCGLGARIVKSALFRRYHRGAGGLVSALYAGIALDPK
jgi:hypothetical protein